MALILNLLYLTPEEERAFSHAAPESRQVFLPGDVTAPLRYPDATVILGNPDPETLVATRSLKWLHTWSAGMDRYQKPGVLPAGAALTSSSGAYGQSVSEHLFAMLLALEKRIPAYRDGQKAGVW
ncbi:MAG: D-2-hydroxyacid dehydrogenase, partial [Oscillospiraceae bacterium]